MKLIRIFAPLFAVLAIVVLLAAGCPASVSAQEASPPPFDVGAPGNTPFDQLPACNPGPYDARRSDASRAPDPKSPLAKVCKAEPTSSVPSVDAGGSVPAPSTSGYHFNGNTSDYASHWQGSKGTHTVVNPNVCHGVGCFDSGQYNDFVAAWTMVARHTVGPDIFTQSGWAEVGQNWGTEPCGIGPRAVFAYDTSDNNWHFYCQFPLVDGQRLTTLVQRYRSGFGWEWCNFAYWNEVWNGLDCSWLDLNPEGHGTDKHIEDYTEIFVTEGGIDPHPQWNGQGGIRMYRRAFLSAFGWAPISDADWTNPNNGLPGQAAPPYALFSNNHPSAQDVVVCSIGDRSLC